MRHYSCDSCGTDLTDRENDRIIMTVDATAAPAEFSPDHGEACEDDVEAMAAILAEDEDNRVLESMPAPLPTRCRKQFDLCPGCYRRFLQDPFGRESRKSLAFSKN